VVLSDRTYQGVSEIYFETEELAEKSLKENKKDWEIVRDYKG
jgi:hypothetical protein